jgi:hypothetical protein
VPARARNQGRRAPLRRPHRWKESQMARRLNPTEVRFNIVAVDEETDDDILVGRINVRIEYEHMPKGMTKDDILQPIEDLRFQEVLASDGYEAVQFVHTRTVLRPVA